LTKFAGKKDYWIELLLSLKQVESSPFGGVYVDLFDLERVFAKEQVESWRIRRI
jgi:hypothetical protein